jgi:hypothetical protein
MVIFTTKKSKQLSIVSFNSLVSQKIEGLKIPERTKISVIDLDNLPINFVLHEQKPYLILYESNSLLRYEFTASKDKVSSCQLRQRKNNLSEGRIINCYIADEYLYTISEVVENNAHIEFSVLYVKQFVADTLEHVFTYDRLQLESKMSCMAPIDIGHSQWLFGCQNSCLYLYDYNTKAMLKTSLNGVPDSIIPHPSLSFFVVITSNGYMWMLDRALQPFPFAIETHSEVSISMNYVQLYSVIE